MNPIGILMIGVAVVMMIIAIIVYLGDTGLIRSFNWTSVKDKADYARFLGKALALVAITICLCGLIVIKISFPAGLILFIVLFIAEMVLIAKKSKSHYN